MNPIIEASDRYFADTSRTQQDTREGLQEAIEHIQLLISTLE